MTNDKSPLSTWQKTKLIIKVIEVRLRFVALLLATALIIGYWDSIKNHWEKWIRPASVAVQAMPSDQEFYCPMHPQVVRDSLEPNGQVPKCPICGMPLSLRKKGEAAPLPQGITGRVQISPDRIQLAGIKTVEIKYEPLVKQITTTGNVAYDETRLSRIVSRVSGYIEKLYIDKTFSLCQKGEPLADIYSPELFSAAQELITATQRTSGINLADSVKRRLTLLGVSDEEIADMIKSGKATPRLMIRSPQDGYVIVKDIVEGARVEPGMTLLEVADLSSVWIEAEAFENDLPFLREGQEIAATVESVPGRTFTGKVSLVAPRVDTATRTVRVRFAIDNPKHELRPGMFATVHIDTPMSQIEPFKDIAHGPANEVLAVPERAVIDTGAKRVVYVEREPGLFEGVEVQLGPRAGDMYPVLKGLQPGDRVAAAGAFLIDAETRLNPAAASTYLGATGAPRAAAITPPTAKPEAASPAATPGLDALSPEDRSIAMAQGICPISGSPLGSMGTPVKVVLNGQTVFLCCGGCKDEATKNPEKTLKKLSKSKAKKEHDHP